MSTCGDQGVLPCASPMYLSFSSKLSVRLAVGTEALNAQVGHAQRCMIAVFSPHSAVGAVADGALPAEQRQLYDMSESGFQFSFDRERDTSQPPIRKTRGSAAAL